MWRQPIPEPPLNKDHFDLTYDLWSSSFSDSTTAVLNLNIFNMIINFIFSLRLIGGHTMVMWRSCKGKMDASTTTTRGVNARIRKSTSVKSTHIEQYVSDLVSYRSCNQGVPSSVEMCSSYWSIMSCMCMRFEVTILIFNICHSEVIKVVVCSCSFEASQSFKFK